MESKQLVEEWIDAYGDELLRMCFLYLKDYHLAEDAVQETLWKAWNSYGTFRQDASVRTWLVRIAVNCCKNTMRTRWFQSCRFGLEHADVPDRSSPFQDMEQLLEKSTIAGAIASLGPKDREVLLLYYYQQFDTREIAAILSKKENTILKRLSRARNRLKEQLLKEGYKEGYDG